MRIIRKIPILQCHVKKNRRNLSMLIAEQGVTAMKIKFRR